MNEINNTVPTAEVVRCKDCKHAIKSSAMYSKICGNVSCPCRERFVDDDFYCALGELLQQSHGDEPI